MGPLDDQVVRNDSLTATPDGLDIAVYSHWYRALPLTSLVRADLTVDGERIDPASLAVTVNGHTYGFDQLPRTTDDRWEMGERAQLAFETDEPLAPGEHDVTVAVRLRISYMPVPGGGRDSKRLTLAA